MALCAGHSASGCFQLVTSFCSAIVRRAKPRIGADTQRTMLVGRRFRAAARFTRCPVSTLPVNATLATSGWPLHMVKINKFE